MKNYNILITEPAEQDLQDIVHYISKHLFSPTNALQLLDMIESSVTNLKQLPERHPLIQDEPLATLGYRKLVVKNYLIFYFIDDEHNTIYIERIVYARRNWNNIL